MKHSFAVGIGLFLVFIGMYESGIVTSGAAGMPDQAPVDSATHLLRVPPVPVKLGNLHAAQVQLAIVGFLAIAVLNFHKVKGSILLAMVGTAIGHRTWIWRAAQSHLFYAVCRFVCNR